MIYASIVIELSRSFRLPYRAIMPRKFAEFADSAKFWSIKNCSLKPFFFFFFCLSTRLASIILTFSCEVRRQNRASLILHCFWCQYSLEFYVRTSVRRYRMGGGELSREKNFRDLQFDSHPRNFSPRNLGACRTHLRLQSVKVFSAKFHLLRIRESFLPRKFIAIRYVVVV